VAEQGPRTSAARRLAESGAALRAVFQNPALRRLQLAWAGSTMGQWLSMVALGVYAFNAGGASAVGALGVARYVFGAIAAPPLALLADRLPRVRVMVASSLARAAAFAAMAVDAALDGSAWPVYVLACAVTMASTAFRPAQASALPALARTPEELTAANVTAGTISTLTGLFGAALGGVLFAATGTATVFAVTGACFVLSALSLARVRVDPARIPSAEAAQRPKESLVRETLAGAALIARDASLRAIVGLYAAAALVWSVTSVLVVVLALDDLDLGESGVGYLTGVTFIGGLVGAVAAALLAGSGRLGTAGLGLGVLAWGAPVAVIGLVLEAPVAFVAFAITGIGGALIEVAAMTLLQRTVPDEVMGRVFGVLETLTVAALALGSALAPVLVSQLGMRSTLIATGALTPVLTALAWRRLVTIDAIAARPGARRIELLRGIAIFAPLPEATIESLAGHLRQRRAAAGEVVVRQGEPGEHFYVVEAGELDVSVDGARTRGLEPGDFFGEIALLREVPRTATVTAVSDARLLVLDRDPFIAAVTGHAPSAEAADAVIDTRLLQPRM
jgi:MFS family permease